MKKIQKNKKGFTLIEMVLVIAIIVILASVLFVSIKGYLDKANAVGSVVSARNSAVNSMTGSISTQESQIIASMAAS